VSAFHPDSRIPACRLEAKHRDQMIVDLLDQTRLPLQDCDVCILGAGPAGITLALTLARLRPDWQIVLAEGGGESLPTPDENDSYRPAGDDPGVYPVGATRLRFLGGTSNHWGGWSRPMDPDIFEPRDWLGNGGWPIAHAELARHYDHAATWCEIGSNDYDADTHLEPWRDALLDVSGSSLLCHKLFRFSPPTRFGVRYRPDLQDASNVQCWLNATAVGLGMRGDRIHEAELANRTGLRARLKARHFVVAMGGIENARFLLAAAAGGAPSDSGLASPALGRYFADHLGFAPALVLLPARLEYGRRSHESGPVMPILSLKPEAQRELELGNFAITPVAHADDQLIPHRYGRNEALGLRGDDCWWYRMQVVLEPQPDPDSRISLSGERDALGVPRLRIDWHMLDSDRERGDRLLQALASEWGSRRTGRVRLMPPELAFERSPTFVAHHMGATRMGADAEGSVVNGDCRVHGIENLHVAGSSVFPSYGFSNPTLTIVALALRLGEQLSGRSGTGTA
jgi:choline dehydrogenase-like flavoprotein